MQNTLSPTPNFTIKDQVISENRSTIIVEPLEQGYGHTLGNALRRVMLTSLSGTAFVTVRIKGVDHQFTTIKGVTEDVLDMILNLKSIRLRSTGAGPWVARLQVKGPKNVVAGDLECEGGLEIINVDQHIATLDKGGVLDLELTAELGTGYVQATDRKSTTIGDISLDSLYSPVTTVSYGVDSTRVGRRTDFDKLILDVVTDGSLTPVEAVQRSAAILASQFAQIVEPVVIKEPDHAPELSPEEQEVLRLTVEELDLPTRIANALRKGGFKTVGDLKGAPKSVVVKVKNLGEKSIEIVEKALAQKSVTLGV